MGQSVYGYRINASTQINKYGIPSSSKPGLLKESKLLHSDLLGYLISHLSHKHTGPSHSLFAAVSVSVLTASSFFFALLF